MNKTIVWMLVIGYVIATAVEILFGLPVESVLRMNVFMTASVLLGILLGKNTAKLLEKRFGGMFTKEWCRVVVLVVVYLVVYVLLEIIINPFPNLF